MNSAPTELAKGQVDEYCRTYFDSNRRAIAHRLFTDLSFSAVEAMAEMGQLVESYLDSISEHSAFPVLWIAGSLGRREMLPNSDLDLFVIHKACCEIARDSKIRIPGLDMFELGELSWAELSDLLKSAVVDANPFIDGRPLIDESKSREVGRLIQEISSPDRQMTNFVSEYFYYHYFDFPWKRVSAAANMKYSSGSSRVTLFFNFYNRMVTNRFPNCRSQEPEFEEGLEAIETRLSRAAPRRQVELVQIVKNAAMSAYYATGDLQLRYVSRRSLEIVFELCRQRLNSLGIRDTIEFVRAYTSARVAIAKTVDELLECCLADHSEAQAVASLMAMPATDLVQASNKLADANPAHAGTFLTVAAWRLVVAKPPPYVVRDLARSAMTYGISLAWGALMAVACSPTGETDMFLALIEWLDRNETGAYLTKLITRNPAASPAARARALISYNARERVQQFR